MIYSLALILIVLSQLIFSCGTENQTKELSLTSNKWMLQKFTTGKVSETTVNKPGRYTLRLNEKGNFKMESDCNKCSGNYTSASKFIKFTEFDCSKKMCGKGSYDYHFRTSLEKASSFKIKGNELILQSYKGKMFFSVK